MTNRSYESPVYTATRGVAGMAAVLALSGCVEITTDDISVERAMQGDCEDVAGKRITDNAGNEVVVARPDCADDTDVARMALLQIQTNGISRVVRKLEFGEVFPVLCKLKSANGESIAIEAPAGIAYNKYRSQLTGLLYVDAGTVVGDALLPPCDINKRAPQST